jgi:hypothetical protein
METLRRAAWDRPYDRYSLTIRYFLRQVFLEAGGRSSPRGSGGRTWKSEFTPAPGGSLPDWSEFVPTLFLLAPAGGAEAQLSTDVDQRPAQFLIAVKTVRKVKDYRMNRIQAVAARAFLSPPACAPEVDDRAAFLDRSGLGVRATEGGQWTLTRIFARLTTREHRRLGFLIPAEQCAVLVAAGRPVVAFSPGGDWPRHPLACEVAARLGCRLVRRSLNEVPAVVRRQLSFVRYRLPPTTNGGGHE